MFTVLAPESLAIGHISKNSTECSTVKVNISPVQNDSTASDGRHLSYSVNACHGAVGLIVNL